MPQALLSCALFLFIFAFCISCLSLMKFYYRILHPIEQPLIPKLISDGEDEGSSTIMTAQQRW